MKVVIADDEGLARELMRNLLALSADVQVVGEAADAEETLALVRDHDPDLVFLDIGMPGMSGMVAAELLSPAGRPLIVFATAHSTFATDAFDLDATDYLMKPINRERLAAALERARRRLDKPTDTATPAVTTAETPEDAIWIPVRNGQVRVALLEVSYVTADRDHVFIHVDGHVWMHRITLARIEALTAPHGLVRVHRSVLVRPARVAAVIHVARGLKLRMDCGKDLPVGPRYRALVRHWTLGI